VAGALSTKRWSLPKIWAPPLDGIAVVEQTGLTVESALDTRSYQKGIKVSKAVMKSLDITGDQFHPEWTYTIRPRQPARV
jgi:Rhodopirellula transposase DDE domain